MIDTAEFTKSDLRKARESANLTRWQAGDALGVSQDTLKRWEDPMDKSKPASSDVSRMEDLYGYPGLWYAWMHSNDDGFRDRMPPPAPPDLKTSVLALFGSMQSLIEKQTSILLDAADGIVDNKIQAEYVRKTAMDISGAARCLAEEIKRQVE